VLAPAVHGLAATPRGLAAATSGGLWLVSDAGGPVRLDVGNDAPAHRFTAVAWWRGSLFAGTLDGLHRHADGAWSTLGVTDGLDAGWITVLAPDGDRLLVGTYDQGLHAFDGRHVAPVPGIERQWVPANGVQRAGDVLWVGGIGMPAVRLDGDGATAVALPAADVYAFARDRRAIVFLTSSGPLWTPAPRADAGTKMAAAGTTARSGR
jgi:hypothetical protein